MYAPGEMYSRVKFKALKYKSKQNIKTTTCIVQMKNRATMIISLSYLCLYLHLTGVIHLKLNE